MDVEEFRAKYKEEHAACPKCGSERYSTTLVDSILDLDNKETYKDLNECVCVDCGDEHVIHDRVKKGPLETKTN